MSTFHTIRRCWFWGVVVVALAAVLVVAFRAWPRPLPIGRGPAGPDVPVEPFRRVWSERPVLLVGIGDSITAGFGSSDSRGYVSLLEGNDDARFPDLHGRDLAAVFPRLKVRNLALSGSVSAQHLERQLPQLEPQPEEVRGLVVITTGGNDLIHDYGRAPPRDGALYGCSPAQAETWAAAFRQRLDALLEGVEERFPGGCEIFLANIYDPTDGVGDLENAPLPLPPWPDGLAALELFNRHLAEAAAARPRVHLIDLHAAFLGHGFHCRHRRLPHYRPADPHYWYFDNLEDPNDRGYDAIRRVFLSAMVEVFNPPPDTSAVPPGP